MTDNEIIKALVSVISGENQKCSFKHCNLAVEVYDLINRQKAEIERLQQKYDLSEAEREANVKGFTESLITVRAEAVKEFAELVTADYPEMEYYLNGLVKEMTEDEGK